MLNKVNEMISNLPTLTADLKNLVTDNLQGVHRSDALKIVDQLEKEIKKGEYMKFLHEPSGDRIVLYGFNITISYEAVLKEFNPFHDREKNLDMYLTGLCQILNLISPTIKFSSILICRNNNPLKDEQPIAVNWTF